MYVCDTETENSREAQTLPLGTTPKSANRGGESMFSWAMSSDGRWLARGNPEGTVDLWEIKSQSAQQRASQPISQKPVFSLAFSPDGKSLAIAAEDKVALWDVESDTIPVTLSSKETVTSIAFNSEGTILAMGHADGMIHLRSMHTLDAEPKKVSLPKTAIRSLAFSPIDNGRWLAAGGEDGMIHIVDPQREDFDALRDEACEVVGRNLSWNEWQQYMSEDDYRAICKEKWPVHSSVIKTKLAKADRLASEGSLKQAESQYDEARHLDLTLTIDSKDRAKRLYASKSLQQR